MGRKIAIVGKAATSAFAPWHDEDWEIWGMPWLEMPRATRLFEIHNQQSKNENPSGDKTGQWLGKALEIYPGVPVYCHPDRTHLFPDGVDYPFDEIEDFLPFVYLENTIVFQIALALYEGVDEVGIFGIHMMGRGEFVWQRPSVTYLIGLAQGLGVKVTIPPGCPLFLSGYEAGRYGLGGPERGYTAIAGVPPSHLASSQKG